jgi:hypothetical protein
MRFQRWERIWIADTSSGVVNESSRGLSYILGKMQTLRLMAFILYLMKWG